MFINADQTFKIHDQHSRYMDELFKMHGSFPNKDAWLDLPKIMVHGTSFIAAIKAIINWPPTSMPAIYY